MKKEELIAELEKIPDGSELYIVTDFHDGSVTGVGAGVEVEGEPTPYYIEYKQI